MNGAATAQRAPQATPPEADVDPTLRQVRELAFERFPDQRPTLEAFFSGIEDSMAAPASPASRKTIGKNLRELEDFLDALLLGEKYDLRR